MNWFDENGNLIINSEEFYCYTNGDLEEVVIKDEIVDFVYKNFNKYSASSDIVAIYYAMNFAEETKGNYDACILLCRNGITANPNWDKLEIRN